MIELGEKWTKNKVESSSKNKQFSIMIDHKMFGPNNKKKRTKKMNTAICNYLRLDLVKLNSIR